MTYILDQSGKRILNSDFCESVFVLEKADAKLIVATKSKDDKPVTLGAYQNAEEAKGVLLSLLYALSGGEPRFEMPLSEAVAPERMVYDKRTKRKGGS